MPESGLRALLRPGDTLLVGTGAGEPQGLVDELCAVAPSIGRLRVIQVMTGSAEQLADASGPALRLVTPVPSAKSRKAIAEGRAEILPLSMSQLVDAIVGGSLRVDGVLLQGRALDPQHSTLGLIADVLLPAWQCARFRALELNAALPRVASALLPIAAADYVLHTAHAPREFPIDPVSDPARIIAQHVAAIVPDGATIELGVGRALAGVVGALAGHRRGLAMHTGIVGNAAMELIRSGCVSRPIRAGAMAIGATAMGTADFYAWADGNESIALVDSRVAHRATFLASLPRFCAINAALQVDLAGNVNSIVHRGRTVGGAGGSGDFAEAGARGHASIVALFSTLNDGASTIVESAEAVSIPAAHVTHVVTEHGVASIRGLAPEERARAIRSIAAPQHRDALANAA